jgi:hypothetical protein
MRASQSKNLVLKDLLLHTHLLIINTLPLFITYALLIVPSFAPRRLAVSIKTDSRGVEQSGCNLVPGMLNEHVACVA